VRGEWTPAAGIGWQHEILPDAPTGLLKASKDAWAIWFRAWFAAHWTPDDLPGLRQVVRLYDQVERGEFTRATELRQHKALHGTARSLINNMIIGVSKGFVKDLEIQGVGLRAAVKGKDLDLSLGRSHPLLHPIPSGLTVTVNENTKIKVEGIDKQLVGQFAAEVRGYYPPEPYKGKGVRYAGEKVRRKEGKSVGK
jgi:large subunit ribosomal protein L6